MLENEQRSHFALWCLLKSPLFIGADLRKLSKVALKILTAEEVIAVNQDPLGVAGDLIWKEGPIEVAPLLTLGLACVASSICSYLYEVPSTSICRRIISCRRHPPVVPLLVVA